MSRKIKFARFAEGHRLAGIEKNPDRQLAFLLVELQKQPVEPPVEVPVEVTEIVAGDVIAIIGELDRLPAGLAAPLALEGTLGAPPREQLELLEAAQKFGGEEGSHFIGFTP